MNHHNFNPPDRNKQSGVTLIELMVGIAIGLLTIAVAMGAIMVSRGVSGTISDATQIQQQASYAFRVIGQQLRQAASIKLNLAAQKPLGSAIEAADVVAFTPDKLINPIAGKDSPGSGEYALSVPTKTMPNLALHQHPTFHFFVTALEVTHQKRW